MKIVLVAAPYASNTINNYIIDYYFSFPGVKKTEGYIAFLYLE
jgi:hypothetical protein